MSAPGYAITSTSLNGGYATRSGTSFAAPMLAGAAARCFASGDCKLADGPLNTQKVLAAAAGRSKAYAGWRWNGRPDGSYQFPGERFRRVLGPLVFADVW